MRIDCSNKSLCCGCSACEQRCPVSAIKMVEDEKGFKYPHINVEKCIECGLCLKVCDYQKDHTSVSNIEKAFALVVNDKDALMNSTSGGAFTVLSDVVLDDSGFVVGSVMDNEFSVHHIVSSERDVRNRMRGSKYVQSDLTGVFLQIEQLLKSGKQVFFTGTPCQCGALKSFLGKDYDSLIVVDLFCHGVPSNRLFKDHISFLEESYNSEIIGYSFRDKRYGWNSYNNTIVLENGECKSRWINQAYHSFFVKNISLRPSCYNCRYRNFHRPSDITIADFWGVDKIFKQKNKNTGVSLVLAHSSKGLTLIDECSKTAMIKEVDWAQVRRFVHSNHIKSKVDPNSFWREYQCGGYRLLVANFFDNSFYKRVRFWIRKMMKRVMLLSSFKVTMK